jgi:hypothetical protein
MRASTKLPDLTKSPLMTMRHLRVCHNNSPFCFCKRRFHLENTTTMTASRVRQLSALTALKDLFTRRGTVRTLSEMEPRDALTLLRTGTRKLACNSQLIPEYFQALAKLVEVHHDHSHFVPYGNSRLSSMVAHTATTFTEPKMSSAEQASETVSQATCRRISLRTAIGAIRHLPINNSSPETSA